MENKKTNNILLVTFDHHRLEYPTMSYSIASILAALKHYNIPASHYSFDIRKFEQTPDGGMPFEVIIEIDNLIDYIKKFRCIAIGVTRWSETFAYMLIRRLDGYKGKIIVGGYEITALKTGDDYYNLITEDFKAHHLIQGYAEKPLVKLMLNEYPEDQKLLREELDIDYLFSPYNSGVLTTYSRKIYWETKRGCNYKCGFCEWGNAQVKSVSLSAQRIVTDIEIFSKSNIEEINILDATFNVGNSYMSILKDLVEKTNAKITFQARFEALNPEFLEFCHNHKGRLYLEFGLQTIHINEMKVIGRKNNLSLIKESLGQLNRFEIDYEVSIIYAIPGQTISSFIDTIEFLRVEGCENIKAYPLQIPRNSQIEIDKGEYKIRLKDDRFYVNSVNSSFSFNQHEKFDMDCLAFSLGHEERIKDILPHMLTPIQDTQYQYELQANVVEIDKEIFDKVISDTFIRFHHYASFLSNRMSLTTEIPKGYIRADARGYLGCAIGQQPYNDWQHMPNKSEIQSSYFRTIFGESGYLYIIRDFRKKN